MGPTRAGGIPHGASVAAVGLRSRSVVAAGAFLFLLAGCAGAAQIRTATEPCVPPGMPPVATWVMVDSRVVAMRAPDRQVIFAALIEYRVGPTHVRGMWIGRALIFVDPDADDPTRMLWRNQGALDANWVLVGIQTCDWVEDSGRRA